MSYAHSMSSRSGSGLSSRLSNGVFGSSSLHGAYGGISHSVSKFASSGLSSGSGGGLSFSGAGTSGFGMNFASSSGDGLASANEKYTMQNLNDRLCNYMEKVRSLEEANNKLEEKIHEWYEHQGSVTVREQNYSPYYATIEELREKISKATTENNQILLAIDNARLAADDFKQKYENELHLRMAVEGDIQGLRKVLDELTLCKSDSEMQIENLTEELTYMKKNHEEEMNEKGQQIRGTVNVEMDAAPGTDLSKILGDMREQYEYITERNRREAEAWYQAQCDSLHKEVATHTEQVQTSKTEITDLRRTLQGLEIELQSQHTMRAGLEASVSETEARYATQLNHIQTIIGSLEDQLGDLRSELDHQNQEYKSLLNIKAHLDAEIATYHKLLDEHDHSIGGTQKESSGSTKTTTTTTTTTTVKQEAPSTDKK